MIRYIPIWINPRGMKIPLSDMSALIHYKYVRYKRDLLYSYVYVWYNVTFTYNQRTLLIRTPTHVLLFVSVIRMV